MASRAIGRWWRGQDSSSGSGMLLGYPRYAVDESDPRFHIGSSLVRPITNSLL